MALYIVSLIVLSVVLVPIIRNWKKRKRDYQALKTEVHKTFGKYSFLVDKNFRVTLDPPSIL